MEAILNILPYLKQKKLTPRIVVPKKTEWLFS